MFNSVDFKFKGTLLGCDSRLPIGYKEDTFLRESKNFWIAKNGGKFRKSDGWLVGIKFPMIRLDLASVKPR